jgi:dihydroorotate dehydrogenase
MKIYRVLRPLLFQLEAETAHKLAIRAAELASTSQRFCSWISAHNTIDDERLQTEVARMRLSNPIGLAAGFDKSAQAVPLLSAFGFGHVEVGSISAEPSAGNARPRLFRLPQDEAIVVNYGLPNDGAERVGARLLGRQRAAALGINIVSTNHGPGTTNPTDDEVIDDYVRSVRCLQDSSDYLCLNLSCPNTREGRGFFQDRRRLHRLLEALAELGIVKPLFLKVAPFADASEIESLLDAIDGARFVSGFSVNLPPGKPAGLATPALKLAQMPGAVSGRPCAAAADRTIAELYRRMDQRRYRIIGSGGVFTAADAYRKIRLGASLVQLLTALIYEGPCVVQTIKRGLADLLKVDGFRHVGDAVGTATHHAGDIGWMRGR